MSVSHQAKSVSALSACVAGLPLLIYSGARLLGLLPSREAWARSGSAQHGPWHASVPGGIFLLSLIAVGLLALGTLLIGAGIAVRGRSVGVLAFTGALVAVASGALVWYVKAFLWVIR